jgi:hypothetical protein
VFLFSLHSGEKVRGQPSDGSNVIVISYFSMSIQLLKKENWAEHVKFPDRKEIYIMTHVQLN